MLHRIARIARIARRRSPATPLDVPLLIYLAFSAVGGVVSPLPAAALRRLITLLLGAAICYTLLIWIQKRPTRLHLLARLLPLLGALIAVGGLFTLEWPAQHLVNLSALTSRLPHLSGPFTINPNQMAGVLLLLLPLAALNWKKSTTSRRRLLFAIICAAIFSTFILTQSRNGWLSLLVAAAGALLWRRRRFILLAAIVLLLLILPLTAVLLPANGSLTHALDRLDATTKSGPAADQSWLSRIEMWSAAADMMADYPLLGAGLYTFAPVSRANYVYQTMPPTFAMSHAHNLFLHTGAGLGWPGWLAVVLLWLSLLHALWQASARAPTRWQPLGRALGAAVLAYLSFNTWDVLALEQWAGLVVWLILALAVAYTASWGYRPNRRRRLLQSAPLFLFLLLLPTLPRTVAHLRLDKARLAGGSPALLSPDAMGDPRRQALVHFLQGRPAQAHRRWAQDPRAVPFLVNQGQQAYLAGEETAAIAWYSQALALDPTAGSAYYWRGLAHERLGHDEPALADYRRAADLAHNRKVYGIPLAAVAWDRQGQLLAQQGAWQAAVDAFTRASALAPHHDDYRQRLQQVRRALSEQESPQ